MKQRLRCAIHAATLLTSLCFAVAGVGAQDNHPPADCQRLDDAPRTSHPLEIGVAVDRTRWPPALANIGVGPTVTWHVWSEIPGASRPIVRTISFQLLTNPRARHDDIHYQRETQFRVLFTYMAKPLSSNVWPELSAGATIHRFAWSGSGAADATTGALDASLAIQGNPSLGASLLPGYTRSLLGNVVVRGGVAGDLRTKGGPALFNPIGSLSYLLEPFAACQNQRPRQ